MSTKYDKDDTYNGILLTGSSNYPQWLINLSTYMTVYGCADTIDETFVPPTSEKDKAKWTETIRKASLIVFKSLDPSIQNKLSEANPKDLQTPLGIIKFLTKHYAEANIAGLSQLLRQLLLIQQGPHESTLNFVDKVDRLVEHLQRVIHKQADFSLEELLALVAIQQGATAEVKSQLNTIMLDTTLKYPEVKKRLIAAYDSSKTRSTTVSSTDVSPASALKVATVPTLDESNAPRSLPYCDPCSAATGKHKYHTEERCPILHPEIKDRNRKGGQGGGRGGRGGGRGGRGGRGNSNSTNIQ